MSAKRLKPLQMLADLKVEQTQARYLEQQRQLTQQQARLDDLGRYHGEYRRVPGGEGSPMLLQNRLAFAERVGDAVRQQAVAVERARGSAELHQGYWIEAERGASALDKVVERRRLAEGRKAAARAQRELDEFAARGARGRP